MRVLTRAIIAGFVAAILGCTAVLAVASGNTVTISSKLGTSVRIGTILSMNSTRMVVVRMHKGRDEHLELILNSGTVWKGEIAVGSQVTVHYRIENNQNIATSIQVRKSPDRV